MTTCGISIAVFGPVCGRLFFCFCFYVSQQTEVVLIDILSHSKHIYIYTGIHLCLYFSIQIRKREGVMLKFEIFEY